MRRILVVARVIFAGLAVIAMIIAAGSISGGTTPGAHVDWIGVGATIMLGLGALAAAAWVLARGIARTAVAWVGIAVVLIASLLPTYFLFTTQHGSDVIALALIPTVIGVLVAAVMARARWVAGLGTSAS